MLNEGSIDRSDGYYSLANAIIIMAYRDLENLIYQRKKINRKIETGSNTLHNRNKIIDINIKIDNILYFFKSDYYSSLTSVDYRYLLKDLKILQ